MFNGPGFLCAQNTAATHRALAILGKYLQCIVLELSSSNIL